MKIKALVDGEEKIIDIEANNEGYFVIDTGNIEIWIDNYSLVAIIMNACVEKELQCQK